MATNTSNGEGKKQNKKESGNIEKDKQLKYLSDQRENIATEVTKTNKQKNTAIRNK